MNRRNFFKLTATSTGGIMLLPQFLAARKLWDGIDENDEQNILVFIQLNGGNDGLNTFIPYTDSLYHEYRPGIGIMKDKAINVSNGMGFHPALKDFATIMQEGNLSVIQNVGYPNPNRSHFRSQEIWQTATDSNKYADYGWLGRFLDLQCNDESLCALNIDNVDNLALKSSVSNCITVKDFNKIKTYASGNSELVLSENPQLDFVRKLQYTSLEGMEEISRALQQGSNYNEAYSTNALSKNLEWIARLIKGKLNSKVYYTSLNGFDTHNNQTTLHQKQLSILNDAVFSFYKDLKSSNLLKNVTVVIFSEFGRRVQENGSGTDHGTAGPMFVIGGKTAGKVFGKNPDLSNLDKGDLIYNIDFRSVYATLLKQKFNFDPTQINISNQIIKDLF